VVFIIGSEEAIRLYPVFKKIVEIVEKIKEKFGAPKSKDIDPAVLRKLERFKSCMV